MTELSPIEYASKAIGFQFKQGQQEALEHFVSGRDVFASLPTGYGKSAIYQAAPFCADVLFSRGNSIAIVISPLISLMKDQLNSLELKGIPSVYLGDDEDHDGNVTTAKIVLASPETMLGGKGRRLLLQNRNRICGLFVDESHCVAMW